MLIPFSVRLFDRRKGAKDADGVLITLCLNSAVRHSNVNSPHSAGLKSASPGTSLTNPVALLLQY